MQTFLVKTRAGETRGKETTLNRKRNLFGLGLTSLIAACGDKAAGGGDGATTIPDNGIATYTSTVDLPDEVVTATDLSAESGFAVTLDNASSEFTVAITGDTTSATLTFSDGKKENANAAKIYKLTATDTQYDLVVSSFAIDKNEKIGTTEDNNPEHRKGGIFIFWDVAGIQDETLGAGSTTTINQRLEIKGAAAFDEIGSLAPEFLQMGGAVNNYDIVFAGRYVDRVNGLSDTGAIYVLWDVADYAEATKTIDLGSIADATSGSLAIYGKIARDYIGTYAPQLLELGSADNAYDMIIRSHTVNKAPTLQGIDAIRDEGAIYILWDVTGYHDTEALHKTVTLDNSLVDASGAYTNGANYGLLAIYGGTSNDQIGLFAPEFLQLGGVAGDKLDMVIRSFEVDKSDASGGTTINTGAIYILWDVADYAGQNKTIDLGKLDEADPGLGATAGSLAIYGAARYNIIGTYAPEFLEIAGKDNNQDMVIRSYYVSNPVDGGGTVSGTGAIYILWDVADYYSAGTDKNKTIDFAIPADASSGLLTIYGRAVNENLGNEDNDILYGADAAGNKILTNIDGDDDATKDISFRDRDYTYILFGDKVATTTGTGVDEKVISKTVDLTKVEDAFSADINTNAGFFSYNFDTHEVAFSSIDAEDRVGYRFTSREADLAAVQTDYDRLSSSLSDTDADLAVWDIA